MGTSNRLVVVAILYRVLATSRDLENVSVKLATQGICAMNVMNVISRAFPVAECAKVYSKLQTGNILAFAVSSGVSRDLHRTSLL